MRYVVNTNKKTKHSRKVINLTILLTPVLHMCCRCDGVVDCSGGLNEDEGAACQEENIHPSCLEWYMAGETKSGRFYISPGGTGKFYIVLKF